jgi:hypothetical protein
MPNNPLYRVIWHAYFSFFLHSFAFRSIEHRKAKRSWATHLTAMGSDPTTPDILYWSDPDETAFFKV